MQGFSIGDGANDDVPKQLQPTLGTHTNIIFRHFQQKGYQTFLGKAAAFLPLIAQAGGDGRIHCSIATPTESVLEYLLVSKDYLPCKALATSHSSTLADRNTST